MAKPPDKEEIPVVPPLPAKAIDDDVEVVVLSPAEQSRAVQRALQEIGLTREQIREQARRKQFTSVRAHQLWMATGGTI